MSRDQLASGTGISGIGVALPSGRVSPAAIHAAWDNEPLDIVQRAGVRSRTVCDPDADVVTLAAEACEVAIGEAADRPIGALFLGTQTSPYLTRASAAVVAEIVGLGPATFVTDVQFSGKSGTAALLCALSWVAAGHAESALACGADTLGPHVAPGDPAEYTAGSGAAAVVISRSATPKAAAGEALASFDGWASSTSDTADAFRLDGERYIRTGGSVMTATDIGLVDHCQAAWSQLATSCNVSPGGVDHLVVSQPDATTPVRLARRLGFEPAVAEGSVVAGVTGDTGAASPLIGLAAALQAAKTGARIVVVSYGCGAGSDALAFTAQKRPADTGLDAALARSEELTYPAAVRAERRYVSHERLTGSFE